MENLPSHKTAEARQALREKGIRVKFLPPYSPDLNPIENAFSKFKSMVRTADLGSIPNLWNSIGRLILKSDPLNTPITPDNADMATEIFKERSNLTKIKSPLCE